MKPLMAAGDALVHVSPWWTAYVALFMLCALIAAAKGRYVWLLAGMMLGGIPWVIAAFLSARPRSLWARVRARRSQRTLAA